MLIQCQFRDTTLQSDDFAEMLRRMRAITLLLREKSGQDMQWFAPGNTLEEAFLYPAFEGDEPSTALLAILNEKFRRDKTFTFAAIWNGTEQEEKGVSLAVEANSVGRPGTFSLTYSKAQNDGFGKVDLVKEIVSEIVALFPPQYVSVAPPLYFQHQVFKDKPGAGWMLYLPRIITAQQVPEAEALVPLPAPGKKQTGTLIVSIADEVFSLDNPRHIEVANQIELRLVDQDLIDRYRDMYRAQE